MLIGSSGDGECKQALGVVGGGSPAVGEPQPCPPSAMLQSWTPGWCWLLQSPRHGCASALSHTHF